jgi:hypothetical protein
MRFYLVTFSIILIAMPKVLVINPVKNSVESTLECAQAIADSGCAVKHIIFNDFSSEETKQCPEQEKAQIGYELIHLEDIIHLRPIISWFSRWRRKKLCSLDCHW